MGCNSFGKIFRITTWGESHGPAIGVVIDGCPAGIPLCDEEIQSALRARAPGRSPHVSPRAEKDEGKILSGVFEGKTTGAPIAIMIPNMDVDSSKYEPIKDLLRPGHANYTYLQKYGLFDYRGGGRSSARETACRVAAGAVARKFLKSLGVVVVAYVQQIGNIEASLEPTDPDQLVDRTCTSPIFCPDSTAASSMMALIDQMKGEGDSIGGVVGFSAFSVPSGLGDPVYDKLDARLSFAMMGIPGSKGVEIGSGFSAALMKGSEHNDLFSQSQGVICTETNNAGGILGGISTGMPIVGKVVFKPTSSIAKPMKTVTTKGEESVFQMPPGSRHDPCIAIRAVPVVEAMLALVLADAVVLNRCARL